MSNQKQYRLVSTEIVFCTANNQPTLGQVWYQSLYRDSLHPQFTTLYGKRCRILLAFMGLTACSIHLKEMLYMLCGLNPQSIATAVP